MSVQQAILVKSELIFAQGEMRLHRGRSSEVREHLVDRSKHEAAEFRTAACTMESELAASKGGPSKRKDEIFNPQLQCHNANYRNPSIEKAHVDLTNEVATLKKQFGDESGRNSITEQGLKLRCGAGLKHLQTSLDRKLTQTYSQMEAMESRFAAEMVKTDAHVRNLEKGLPGTQQQLQQIPQQPAQPQPAGPMRGPIRPASPNAQPSFPGGEWGTYPNHSSRTVFETGSMSSPNSISSLARLAQGSGTSDNPESIKAQPSGRALSCVREATLGPLGANLAVKPERSDSNTQVILSYPESNFRISADRFGQMLTPNLSCSNVARLSPMLIG